MLLVLVLVLVLMMILLLLVLPIKLIRMEMSLLVIPLVLLVVLLVVLVVVLAAFIVPVVSHGHMIINQLIVLVVPGVNIIIINPGRPIWRGYFYPRIILILITTGKTAFCNTIDTVCIVCVLTLCTALLTVVLH